MKELRKLKKLNEKLTKQLEAKKKRAERFRKRNQRRHVNKNTHSNTEKQSKRRIAQERKSQVESFLLRDESSRLLPGKRDAVGRKQKMQRRVLVKNTHRKPKHQNIECRTGGFYDTSHFM